MSRQGWTQEEIDIVIKYYPTEGVGVAKRLPNRTQNQIYGIAWHHGIKNESRKKRDSNKTPRRQYSEYELNYISEHIKTDSFEDIAKALNRTPNAIRSIAFKSNLKSSNYSHQVAWSKEEIEIMKTYFPIEGIDVQKRLPNRTIPAIYSEASHLGVSINKRKKNSSNSEWTEEEDNILKEHYISDGISTCCKLLPNRSKQAIIMRANRYLDLKKRNIRKWTEEEEEFLKEHFVKDGIDYCYQHLDRTKDSIFQKAIRLNICEKKEEHT
jgi:hypothetical protein